MLEKYLSTEFLIIQNIPSANFCLIYTSQKHSSFKVVRMKRLYAWSDLQVKPNWLCPSSSASPLGLKLAPSAWSTSNNSLWWSNLSEFYKTPKLTQRSTTRQPTVSVFCSTRYTHCLLHFISRSPQSKYKLTIPVFLLTSWKGLMRWTWQTQIVSRSVFWLNFLCFLFFVENHWLAWRAN